jgi:hypothetical protein
MASKFVQGNWLLPNNVNANKQSNYSFDFPLTKYIDLEATSSFDFNTSNFSVSLWMKKDSASGAFQPLVDFGGYAQSPYTQGTTIYSNNENQIHVYNRGSSPSNWLTSITTTTGWNHIVVVRSGDNLTVYINNSTEQVNQTFTGVSSINFGGSATSRISGTGSWDGQIDEVNIFSRALSSGEVSSLYNSGTPGNPFDLSGDPIAYYKLGETAIGQAPGGTWNWQVPNHAQAQFAMQATNANNFTQLVTPITQLGNTHTLSIWINSNGGAVIIGQFFVRGSISAHLNSYASGLDGIYITTDSSNSHSLPLSSIIYRSNGNQLTASIGQLDDSNWHNLIIVRTPTAVKAYIDGGSELTLSGATLTASDTYLLRFLTGIYSAQGAAWPGLVSNAAVWLSDRSSEVANIYNSGEPQEVYTTTPDYWWKLDNSAQISTVPPTTGTTPIVNYKTISSNTLTTFNSKTAIINIGYGFSSGVSMLFDNQINLGTQSTVSYWLLSAPFETSTPRFNTHGHGVNIFANYSDQVGVGTYGGAYILKGPVNDVITFEVYNSTNSSEKATLTFSQANNPTEYAKIFDLNYHNWMFVRDGSNVSFYFDNVLIDSSSSLNATNNTVLVRFSGTMGTAASPTANWGGFKFSNGVEIDEISLFNKALSSSERATLYNSGNAGDISSLSPSIWYNGDSVDFTNSKMLDLSGNSNDASLISTSNGSSNTGLLTNFQQFLIYKEGAFAGGGGGTAGLALVNTDLGLHNPLYSQFSNSFDGSSLINCGSSLSFSTAISISAWFKLSSSGQNGKCIISKHISGSSAPYFVFAIRTTTSNTIQFRVGLEDNSVPIITGSTSVNDTNWHHVVGIFDGSNINIYIDGTSDATSVAASGTLKSVTDKVIAIGGTVVGGTGGSSSDLLNGKIDETSIFNYALSEAQVLEIYNNGKPSDISSLSPVSWWRLGDSSYTNSSNYYVFPNKIANAPDGIGNAAYKPPISADAPKVVAPGVSSGLVELDKKGDAPNSTSNAISYNILKTDQSVYTPKYVTQYTVDNNYSMAFDGTGYISLGSSLDFGTVNTICCWVYKTANNCVLTGDTGNTNDYNIFSGQTQVYYRVGSPYAYWNYTLPLSTWVHFAFVRNGTYSIDFYANGVKQNQVNSVGFTISTKIDTIGDKSNGSHDGGSSPWIGKLDEFAVFNEALTADQIKFDIYGASTTANKSADFINNPNLPDPVVWYRMGD